MKHPKTVKTVLQVLSSAFLLALACTPLASGVATTNWFPSEGTTCDYNVSFTMNMIGGGAAAGSTFDVYDTTTAFEIYPSVLAHDRYVSETSIKNNTAITLRHYYTEETSTQWRRTTTVVIDGVAHTKNFFYFHNTNTSWYPITGADIVFQKTSFMTTGTILDYFNASARVGDEIYSYYRVTFVGPDHIIATYNVTALVTPPDTGFQTYIADGSGHVSQLIMNYHDDAYAAFGVYDTNLLYTAVAVQGTDVMQIVIYCVIGAAGLVLGILVGYAVGKRKRS